jgi:hypothetical protein
MRQTWPAMKWRLGQGMVSLPQRVDISPNPEAHWVHAIIDPLDPNIFSFRPQMVKENIEVRRTK